MNTIYPQEPEESQSTVRALPGIMAQDGPAARRGNPEGGYLSGSGKSVHRQVIDLLSRKKGAAAGERKSREAADRARHVVDERKHAHRGGNRTWLLRWVMVLAVAAEAATAYVGMEALVASQSLAVGLSALTAAVGGGMACVLANRRLNGLEVPATVRIIEGIFVAVLTVLRYESLSVQGNGYLTAAGAAGLAALISALGLLGIEEIVVETHTFGIFLSTLRASWMGWRWTRAKARLDAIETAADAAADKFELDYLRYLLRTEGLPLDKAEPRAVALRAAFTGQPVHRQRDLT